MDMAKIKAYDHDLGAPRNWDHGAVPCSSLRVRFENCHGYKAMASFWKPSDEELEILLQGGFVKLSILSTVHPVVSMTTAHVEVEP